MAISGLIESGFMISIGVTLLLAGLVVYYVRGQLATLSKAVKNQQVILTQFISDVKTSTGNLRGGATDMDTAPSQEPLEGQDCDQLSESSSESEDEEERPRVLLNVAGLEDAFDGRPQESAAKVQVADMIAPSLSPKAPSVSEEDSDDGVDHEVIRKAKVGELREMASEKLGWQESDLKRAKKADLVAALINEC